MRYQIYEAKSVKYDAQQRVGITNETRKALKTLGFWNGNGAFDSKLIADTKTGFTLFTPV